MCKYVEFQYYIRILGTDNLREYKLLRNFKNFYKLFNTEKPSKKTNKKRKLFGNARSGLTDKAFVYFIFE